METSSPHRELWSRDFILLFGSALLTWISFYFLLPTLPIYITRHLGGSPAQVGLIGSLLTVTAIVARPLAGYALDRWGRRWILLAFLVMFSLASFSYNLAQSLLALAAIRVLHGIPFGAVTTAASTVASDLVPAARRGEGMGLFGLAGTLAMAVGPALALSVMGGGQFTRLFLVAGLISLCALVIAWWVRYPDVHNPNASFSLSSLVERRVGWLALATLFTYVGYGGILTFITLYAAQLGITSAGLFFTVYALGLVLSRAVSGRIFDQQGPRLVVGAGMGFLFLSYVILGLWQAEPGYLLAALALGLGFGAVTPSLFAMTINMVTPERRGAANATVFSGIDVGIGMGSNLWGVVAQATGSYATMYLAAGLSVAIPALLFFLKAYPRYVKREMG